MQHWAEMGWGASHRIFGEFQQWFQMIQTEMM